ncbi:MAG: tRNA lysidine(34) synthetase TilS [Lachnospiraceae bacterium]|nr:tRNA lysidine(34) synthetase TilS [Ruminococcus sp.]MCM1273953.1 tRNA lysidine(34) synthetase TilS [Lachnospiraceae bacterium]
MNDFIDNVRQTIADHDMLGEKSAVCAALSGGADSVSLLLALKTLSEERGFALSACHLNHGLRGVESDRDERFCAELCQRLGIPLAARKISVSALSEKHESSEETARRVRYGFFLETLGSLGESAVLATAHTANDNAETVLINLTRGTGLAGLCGIPPVRALGEFRVIRPLIYRTRAEVEEFLAARGQDYVTDRTNLSEDYTRNKIRLKVLPELLKINPSALGTLGRMTGTLREDSAFLEELARKALAENRAGRGYNAAELAKLPAPIRSRAVKTILMDGGIEPSALRISTASELLTRRSARYNPCKNRFFTIRKGVCFVEIIEQHYRRFNEKRKKM